MFDPTPLFIVPVVIIGLPWLILHYMTKWKQAKSLTPEDENLLDLLYETARKLDDRMDSIERIIAADDPSWRQLDSSTASSGPRDRGQPLDFDTAGRRNPARMEK